MSANPSSIAFRRPMRTPMTPAGSAPMTPPMAQAMKPMRRFLRPHGEALGTVQCEPRGEALKGELQQARGDEDLAHAGHDAAGGGHGGIDERAEGGFSGGRLRHGRLAKPESEGGGDGENRARCARKAGCIPSIRPSIRKTIAPTHIWKVTDPVASER